MRKLARYLPLCFVLLMNICGCQRSPSRFESQDPFYRSTGGFDYIRIPLIEPYEAINFDEKFKWYLDLDVSPGGDGVYVLAIKDIKKFAIENRAIFIYTEYPEESASGLGEPVLHWFVLLPDQNSEKGFARERDFQKYLEDTRMQDLNWVDPNDVYRQFNETGCLDWIPDCKNNIDPQETNR